MDIKKLIIIIWSAFFSLSFLNAITLVINKSAGNIPANYIDGVGASQNQESDSSTTVDYLNQTLTYDGVTSMPGFSNCGEAGDWLPTCRKYSNSAHIGSNGFVSYITTGEGSAAPGWYTNPDVFGMYVDSSGRLGTYSSITGDSAGYSYSAGDVIDRYTNTDFTSAGMPEPNFNVIDELEKSVAAFIETQDSSDNETENKPCSSRDDWYCSKETVRAQIDDYCSTNSSNKYCQTRSSAA